MKKVQELIKPVILIIFGALLFLYYLNWLQNQEGALALGIIGVVFAVYYLTIGILYVVIGNKLPKPVKMVFDIVNVSLFAILMFTRFLIIVIYNYDSMGPTAWTIKILSMIASLCLIPFYVLARVTNKAIFCRLGFLFAAVFSLALLLDVLFTDGGNGATLGSINMIVFVIYALFVDVLFSSLPKGEIAAKEEAKAEEEKAE